MKFILSNQTLREKWVKLVNEAKEGQKRTGDIEEEDTSVSISADSTSMFTSAMTLMISTSSPGLSAVSMYNKLKSFELKCIR